MVSLSFGPSWKYLAVRVWLPPRHHAASMEVLSILNISQKLHNKPNHNLYCNQSVLQQHEKKEIKSTCFHKATERLKCKVLSLVEEASIQVLKRLYHLQIISIICWFRNTLEVFYLVLFFTGKCVCLLELFPFLQIPVVSRNFLLKRFLGAVRL